MALRPVDARFALGALGLVALLAPAGPAASAAAKAPVFISGSELYRQCVHGMGNKSFCQGYVATISDTLATGESIGGQRACAPLGTQLDDVVAAVAEWLDAHPREGHRDAGPLAAQAIAEAHPCE